MKGETGKIFLAWTDGNPRTVNLSKLVSGKVSVINGSSGESKTADSAAVPVGAEPVVIEPYRPKTE